MTSAIGFATCALVLGALFLFRHPSYTTAAIFTVLMVSVAGTGISSLGLPKPLWSQYPALKGEVTIVGFSFDEGKAIYLWVLTPKATVPLALMLPWSEPKAAELSDAATQAAAAHSALKGQLGPLTGKPGQPGTKDNEKRMFYPAPQEANSPKQEASS